MEDQSTLTIATTAELRICCDRCKDLIHGDEKNYVIVAGEHYIVLCEMCSEIKPNA